MQHIEDSPNFNPYQSAYRRGHSAETALLRLLNDVYCTTDNRSRTLVVLLDLSAAFDCIEIPTLIQRLQSTFGFDGTVLQWLTSYLSHRQQFIRVGNRKSTSAACNFGVPQGSVLGPLLFSLYISPIGNIIAQHDVRHAQYADDTQLYIPLTDNSSSCTLDLCFSAQHSWFCANGLSLNPDKSEAITLGNRPPHHHQNEPSEIDLGGTKIKLASHVKSLYWYNSGQFSYF